MCLPCVLLFNPTDLSVWCGAVSLLSSEALMNERDIQAELVNEKKTDIIYIQKYEYMMKEMQKNHI